MFQRSHRPTLCFSVPTDQHYVSAFPQTDISAFTQTELMFQHNHRQTFQQANITFQHSNRQKFIIFQHFHLLTLHLHVPTDRYFSVPTDIDYISAFPQISITYQRSHRQALPRVNAILCCDSHLGS